MQCQPVNAVVNLLYLMSAICFFSLHPVMYVRERDHDSALNMLSDIISLDEYAKIPKLGIFVDFFFFAKFNILVKTKHFFTAKSTLNFNFYIFRQTIIQHYTLYLTKQNIRCKEEQLTEKKRFRRKLTACSSNLSHGVIRNLKNVQICQ